MLDSTSASYFHEELSVSQNELFQFLKHNQSDSYASVKEYLNLLPVSDNTYAYNLIYEMGENLSKIMLSPSYGSTYLVNGFIASILAILSNHSSYHITNMKVDYGNDFLIFSQASHLIEDANGIISREDLSKKLSYSGDYINRVIKKYSGVNLTKYCMNLRLIHAQTLLRNTNLSISDISFQLGFKNRTHFYKLFKEKYGKIPSEIRS